MQVEVKEERSTQYLYVSGVQLASRSRGTDIEDWGDHLSISHYWDTWELSDACKGMIALGVYTHEELLEKVHQYFDEWEEEQEEDQDKYWEATLSEYPECAEDINLQYE